MILDQSFSESSRSNTGYGNQVLYNVFSSVDELAAAVWPLFVQNLSQNATTGSGHDESSGSAQAAPSADDLIGESEEEPPDEARIQIARAAGALVDLARGVESHNRLDSDRFALIAHGLVYDIGVISSHIANRPFLRREEIVLSAMEHAAWLRTMLADPRAAQALCAGS